jgi:MFS family permease
MIKDFGIAKTKSEIATYSGYLSASFAFCQFLCCVHWGRFSDQVGRKYVLLFGLFGTSVSMLMFGFAPNFYWAMFARSLMGVLNGNIAVLRTTIGEIATERRHQATAFSTLPLLWNLGSIVGPMIGGSPYLTRPKSYNKEDHKDMNVVLKFFTMSTTFVSGPQFYEDFITKYPYALSNVVVSILIWFSLIMGFLFLEETHPRFKDRRDRGLEIGDWLLARFGVVKSTRPWNKLMIHDDIDSSSVHSTATEHSSLLNPRPLYASVVDDEYDLEDDASIQSAGPYSRRLSVALIRRYSSNKLHEVSSITTAETIQGFNSRVFTPQVRQTVLANFFTAFHTIVYSEFLPVFLAGDLQPKQLEFPFKIAGGFGYSSSTIGTLLSSTGLIGVLGIMFVFPYLDRNFKTISTYRASSTIFPFVYFSIPFLIFTLHEYNPAFPTWFAKLILYVFCCLNAFASAIGFPNILILIHRASPAKHRAFINGSALSLSSLARFMGPIIWGYIMSFSGSHKIGWLSWSILSLLAVVCSFQAFCMEDYDLEMEEEAISDD